MEFTVGSSLRARCAKKCPIFKRPDLTRTTHRRLFISSSPCWEACFTCRFSRNPQLLPHLSFPFRSCLLLRMISHLLSPLPSPLFGLGAHPLRISVRVQSARALKDCSRGLAERTCERAERDAADSEEEISAAVRVQSHPLPPGSRSFRPHQCRTL